MEMSDAAVYFAQAVRTLSTRRGAVLRTFAGGEATSHHGQALIHGSTRCALTAQGRSFWAFCRTVDFGAGRHLAIGTATSIAARRIGDIHRPVWIDDAVHLTALSRSRATTRLHALLQGFETVFVPAAPAVGFRLAESGGWIVPVHGHGRVAIATIEGAVALRIRRLSTIDESAGNALV